MVTPPPADAARPAGPWPPGSPAGSAALAAAIALAACAAAGSVTVSSAVGGDTSQRFGATVAALLVFMALCRLINTADGAPAVKEDYTEEDAALESIAEQRGVVKRFSDRNGWGLITVGVSGGRALQGVVEVAKTSTAQARASRRDVRFYREEKDSLGVDVGDPVAFLLRRDEDSAGWLCATALRRSSRSPEPAAQAPLREDRKPEKPKRHKVPEQQHQVNRRPASQFEQPENADHQRTPSAPGARAGAGHPTGLPGKASAGAGDAGGKVPAVLRAAAAGPREMPAAVLWDGAERERPATTPVVARRLVSSHLAVDLTHDQRNEERRFWGRPEQPEPVRPVIPQMPMGGEDRPFANGSGQLNFSDPGFRPPPRDEPRRAGVAPPEANRRLLGAALQPLQRVDRDGPGRRFEGPSAFDVEDAAAEAAEERRRPGAKSTLKTAIGQYEAPAPPQSGVLFPGDNPPAKVAAAAEIPGSYAGGPASTAPPFLIAEAETEGPSPAGKDIAVTAGTAEEARGADAEPMAPLPDTAGGDFGAGATEARERRPPASAEQATGRLFGAALSGAGAGRVQPAPSVLQ